MIWGVPARGSVDPGFERLLATSPEGRVGAVFAIEASRLARNGPDWHTLIEFCGLVNAIILDEDGVYDPRLPNDRLLLGMKGTMSELELSILRQRSLEALKQKARRGELFLTVAIGYVKVRHNRIEKDPNSRIREAIDLVFSEVLGVPEHPAGASVDAAGADRAACGRIHGCRRPPHRLEAPRSTTRSTIF